MIRLAESGRLPDAVVRVGIRRLLRRRLRSIRRASSEDSCRPSFTNARQPIAVDTGTANAQHYELPVDFFRLMLGPRLKYSCCLWSEPERGLAAAEDGMLALSAERAGIRDGMSVLDLGSGWGAFGLWVAERFSRCRVTTVSNSASQQAYIRNVAAERGLGNVTTIRADVNDLRPSGTFDRIVSIEMFEHVRNHARLLDRVATWLADGGKLFVHLFCHRDHAYPFENEGEDDWMARHFFTGGLMPSLDLLNGLDGLLCVGERWEVCGTHYERTLRAWLGRLDDREDRVLAVLGRHYGSERAPLWFVRWRLFLLACAELFGYRGGREWLVAHYLLEPARGAEA